MHYFRYRLAWQGLAWLMIAVVIFLSLTPNPPQPPRFLTWDKAQHCLAYGVLSLWCLQVFHGRWRWSLSLIGMGIMLEYLQGISSLRTFDRIDMLANTLGVILGQLLILTPLGKLARAFDHLVIRFFSRG